MAAKKKRKRYGFSKKATTRRARYSEFLSDMLDGTIAPSRLIEGEENGQPVFDFEERVVVGKKKAVRRRRTFANRRGR